MMIVVPSQGQAWAGLASAGCKPEVAVGQGGFWVVEGGKEAGAAKLLTLPPEVHGKHGRQGLPMVTHWEMGWQKLPMVTHRERRWQKGLPMVTYWKMGWQKGLPMVTHWERGWQKEVDGKNLRRGLPMVTHWEVGWKKEVDGNPGRQGLPSQPSTRLPEQPALLPKFLPPTATCLSRRPGPSEIGRVPPATSLPLLQSSMPPLLQPRCS